MSNLNPQTLAAISQSVKSTANRSTSMGLRVAIHENFEPFMNEICDQMNHLYSDLTTPELTKAIMYYHIGRPILTTMLGNDHQYALKEVSTLGDIDSKEMDRLRIKVQTNATVVKRALDDLSTEHVVHHNKWLLVIKDEELPQWAELFNLTLKASGTEDPDIKGESLKDCATFARILALCLPYGSRDFLSKCTIMLSSMATQMKMSDTNFISVKTNKKFVPKLNTLITLGKAAYAEYAGLRYTARDVKRAVRNLEYKSPVADWWIRRLNMAGRDLQAWSTIIGEYNQVLTEEQLSFASQVKALKVLGKTRTTVSRIVLCEEPVVTTSTENTLNSRQMVIPFNKLASKPFSHNNNIELVLNIGAAECTGNNLGTKAAEWQFFPARTVVNEASWLERSEESITLVVPDTFDLAKGLEMHRNGVEAEKQASRFVSMSEFTGVQSIYNPTMFVVQTVPSLVQDVHGMEVSGFRFEAQIPLLSSVASALEDLKKKQLSAWSGDQEEIQFLEKITVNWLGSQFCSFRATPPAVTFIGKKTTPYKFIMSDLGDFTEYDTNAAKDSENSNVLSFLPAAGGILNLPVDDRVRCYALQNSYKLALETQAADIFTVLDMAFKKDVIAAALAHLRGEQLTMVLVKFHMILDVIKERVSKASSLIEAAYILYLVWQKASVDLVSDTTIAPTDVA